MRKEEEDMILIQSILEDKSVAQRVFYDKYRKILTDYILSKYPHNTDIEDDVSEILIKVFTNLYRYDPEKARVKTWIFAIAKNYMIDKFKKTDILTGSISIGMNDSISLMNLDVTTDTVCFNPEEGNWFYTNSYVTDFENCDALNHVSNSLDACDFSFLDMKYNQGFNYAEIGIEFNVTSSTVSNRVNYIKEKLKESMPNVLE